MNFGVKFVQLPENLDINQTAQLHREIENIVDAGAKIVLLDLKNITFISSSGLMALVAAFKVLHNAGGKLFICSINEQVRMLFELTGVDQVFETFANLEDFNNTLLINK